MYAPHAPAVMAQQLQADLSRHLAALKPFDCKPPNQQSSSPGRLTKLRVAPDELDSLPEVCLRPAKRRQVSEQERWNGLPLTLCTAHPKKRASALLCTDLVLEVKLDCCELASNIIWVS